jgi:rubrerythrin
MEYALDAEKGHFAFYTEAVAAVKGGKDLPIARFYVCPQCGHTVANLPPDGCPVCGTRKFDEIA